MCYVGLHFNVDLGLSPVLFVDVWAVKQDIQFL